MDLAVVAMEVLEDFVGDLCFDGETPRPLAPSGARL
jgi:hypothetical protein